MSFTGLASIAAFRAGLGRRCAFPSNASTPEDTVQNEQSRCSKTVTIPEWRGKVGRLPTQESNISAPHQNRDTDLAHYTPRPPMGQSLSIEETHRPIFSRGMLRNAKRGGRLGPSSPRAAGRRPAAHIAVVVVSVPVMWHGKPHLHKPDRNIPDQVCEGAVRFTCILAMVWSFYAQLFLS